ncbi:ATP-dependent DNA helicase RecG [Pseudomonas sp. AFG_SD02_1510_Pfu_092]|uniref:ATP-binding protein n=1 Tax=Pseudomonas sp. AFG_SD02_1510_Pfu_092 TaxID=2259497 RepID=UPI000DEFE9C8|nr:ATP-binding protein [Pseudomonas sp. AFG_SD02_1510_Pfu_092]RCL28413.1 ATP-dependent DNA helicase RecG [Pseudomonas sp. AFG_SD02_1510_Pfu_092]
MLAASFGGAGTSSMQTIAITGAQARQLLGQHEGHFLDFKAKEIAPAKLTRSISAFANAEGGDIYIGISENNGSFAWNGFNDAEDANPFIHTFEKLFPVGDEFLYEFLSCPEMQGLVLHVAAKKSVRIILASDGFPYLRRNAQKIKIDTDELKRRLELDKGIYSFEGETVDIDLELATESAVMRGFLSANIPNRSADDFLRMELLVRRGLPKVATVLLFTDLPQAALPDRSSVKLARYRTSGAAHRDALVGAAETIEGPLYDLIHSAVDKTKKLVEAHQVQGEVGLELAKYPHETLHEIITNSIIHRDYSLPDHVHIRVFDNRIEVESPGRLAGQVTVENILDTRAIRNGQINRLINKFPDPPNKDMGEGLNTAVEAMRGVRLKDPFFKEMENSFLVTIPHESLATAQEMILEYLTANDTITNKQARKLYPVPTQHRMRAIIQKMVEQNLLEPVEGTQRGGTKYRKP